MRISNLLGGERPTVSFEFFPPKTDAGRDALIRAVGRLEPIRPDFVSVTYGAGGSNRALSIDSCRRLKGQTSGEVMAHLTGVCHTREEIASIADQLWELGIVNIMALRGDRPKDSEEPEPFRDFKYAKDLVRFLAERHAFSIGSGCYPDGHTETPDVRIGIEHVKQKVDAGCEFLVSQMIFDNAGYFRFVDLARSAGVRAPIVPGLMPISGFGQLDRFESQFGVRLPIALRDRVIANEGDEEAIRQVGVKWTTEQVRELLDQGAPGIHFYTLNRSPSTVEVCRALGLTGSLT